MDNEQFLEHMYLGLMGRPSDPGGVAFWLGEMGRFASNEEARWFVLRGFAISPEFAGICAEFGVRAM